MGSAGAPSAREPSADVRVVEVPGKILVYGGRASPSDDAEVNDGSVYDVTANAWTPIPATAQLHPPAYGQALTPSVFAAGSRIAFVDDAEVPGAGVHVFDPVQNAWATSAAFPAVLVGRASMTGFWTGCRVLLLGGLVTKSVGGCPPPVPGLPCDPVADVAYPPDGATVGPI
jgi:hypothetical protein